MLGQKLRAERERQGHSASEAAEATRLKKQHIEALEAEDFSHVAAPAYAKGFIKLYAEFLELDPEPLILDYEENFKPKTFTPIQSEEEHVHHRSDRGETRREKKVREWKWPDLRKIEWPFTFSKQWTLRIVGGFAALVCVILLVSLFTGGEEKTAPVDLVADQSPRSHRLLQDPPEPYLDPYLRP